MMMASKVGLALVFTGLFLFSGLAFGLAPADPSIFIQADPESQEVAAGDSATVKITILSQEQFEDDVDPNPVVVDAFNPGITTMTIEVAADASQGEVTLTVKGQGVTETDVDKTVEVILTVAGQASNGGSVPSNGGSVPSNGGSVPSNGGSGPAVTTTVVSTVTVSTTVTTASTVISTVTDIITTRTPTIGTTTTITEFNQASDFTYPVAVLVIVVILLAVAALALRRPK
jgi:hypothetical protein